MIHTIGQVALWVIVVYVGVCVVCVVWLLGALAVERVRDRRRDPVDKAYADTGMVLRGELLEVERLRALAAADAAEAAWMTPGQRRVDVFLAELFPRNAPKERP